MSGHSEDRDFDDYLRGDSPVSRRYRDLPGDEVPPEMDRSILAQAREAVQHQAVQHPAVPPLAHTDDLAHVRRQQRRLMKWAIPTTLAACALLGVSVVMRSQLPHAPVTQEAVRADSPAAPPAAARAETSKPQLESESLVLIAPPRNAATEFSELASARDAEARSREQAKRQESRSIAQQAEVARQAMSERRLAVAPPPALGDRASGQVAAAAPAPAPAPSTATAAAPPEEQERPSRDKAAESPARAAQVESDSLDQIIVTSIQAPAKHRSGPRGTVARSGSAAAEAQISDGPRAPEEWLEDIRKLRQSGEAHQADEQWREFRKQYPDYEVSATDLARGDSRD